MTDHPTNRSDAGMLKGAPDHSNPAALKEAVERLSTVISRSEVGKYTGTIADTDDLRTILAALSAAEARELVLVDALSSLRTQADNAAYNAHSSGITIDNAQLVRIFEGMEEQAARALTPETPHAE